MRSVDDMLVSEIRLAISETPMDSIDKTIAEERFINKKTISEIASIVGLEYRATQRRVNRIKKRLEETYNRCSKGILTA